MDPHLEMSPYTASGDHEVSNHRLCSFKCWVLGLGFKVLGLGF